MYKEFLRVPAAFLLAGLAVAFTHVSAHAHSHSARIHQQSNFTHTLASLHTEDLRKVEAAHQMAQSLTAHQEERVDAGGALRGDRCRTPGSGCHARA